MDSKGASIINDEMAKIGAIDLVVSCLSESLTLKSIIIIFNGKTTQKQANSGGNR